MYGFTEDNVSFPETLDLSKLGSDALRRSLETKAFVELEPASGNDGLNENGVVGKAILGLIDKFRFGEL